jgi:hypothetical protein
MAPTLPCDNGAPASFLNPSARGMPSRRHFVVLRRAEEHLAALQPIVDSIVPGRALTGEEQAFVATKVDLISQSVDELFRHIEAQATTGLRASLLLRVGRANHKFLDFKNKLRGTSLPPS